MLTQIYILFQRKNKKSCPIARVKYFFLKSKVTDLKKLKGEVGGKGERCKELHRPQHLFELIA